MTETRRRLHAVAELVIAGPQHRRDGTIRLRVVSGGIAGSALDLAVVGPELVWPGGRAPLAGTCRELAELAGVDVGAPDGLYHDHADLGADDPLAIEPSAAEHLLAWFATGDAALRTFAPDAEPVLWPEHFDLGVTLDDVNFGVSPGDGYLAEPYAYVGPHVPPEGDFWNAPFGAVLTATDAAGVAAAVAFFEQGRQLARG